MASSSKCAFLVFLCVIVLLAPSEVHAKSMAKAQGGWYLVEGLCSKFPDCNKHCKEQGFLGGQCLKLGVNMLCFCIHT
ncbi:putative defensin-like protein 30 [Arabidopsis thaliana]|uniref:Knottin scorpion toxin-like superfamily n=1 Tax=Arabidopsis thaliana x Arabidopsis arenosa TaxID=1240361 RepID=A0A8T2ESE0_9BRAS|nr:Knottin scorpion toxin-like superfamily [Arabidopsis thaliana x Arabidopsis arenosa]